MIGAVLTVGHNHQCDIYLKDPSVSKNLCRLRRIENGGSADAILEITGGKGVVEVNGNVHHKDSTVILRGGDEVVFRPSGKHSYVFQQLSDGNLVAPGIHSSVSISEAQSTPLKTMQIESRSGDPAVTGASILASLSNIQKDLSFISPPAKAGVDAQSSDMSSLASGCDGPEDCIPDVDMKDATCNNDEAGPSSRGKIDVPQAVHVNENPNLDSLGLDAEIGKIPEAPYELRPLLRIPAGLPSPHFDISGNISKILYEQKEIRELMKDSDRSTVLISNRREAFKDSLQKGILCPGDIEVSFESFPYYLSDTTKNVLIASTYVHLKCNNFAKYASDLPTMCPRILLSGPRGLEIYQERLAKALAKHFGARLLIVGSLLLPGGLSSRESDSVNSKTEKVSGFAKRAALLQHINPISSVQAGIMGDRVKFVGNATSGTSAVQPTLS